MSFLFLFSIPCSFFFFAFRFPSGCIGIVVLRCICGSRLAFARLLFRRDLLRGRWVGGLMSMTEGLSWFMMRFYVDHEERMRFEMRLVLCFCACFISHFTLGFAGCCCVFQLESMHKKSCLICSASDLLLLFGTDTIYASSHYRKVQVITSPSMPLSASSFMISANVQK